MNRPRKGWLTLPLAVALLALFSRTAWADAIDFSFVFIGGLIVLIPLLAFEVFVEGVFYAWGLKVPYRRVIALSLVANLASLAAGAPVKILNSWLYGAWLPRDLAAYFRAYPIAVGLGTLLYFLVTLAVEFLVVLAWSRRKTLSIAWKRMALTVLAANAATYAVLAPLNYVFTRPFHDIREFTDTSVWASRPLTEIYYIDTKTGHLCSIMSDGSDRKEWIKDDVRDYQMMPDAGLFLYRNASNQLCLFNVRDQKTTLCPAPKDRYLMNQISFPPHEPSVPVFGRFGNGGWFASKDWGASFSWDKAGSIEVVAEPGLGSRLSVTTPNGSIVLADNPGLLHLAARHFNDVCILPDQAGEVVFDDGDGLYLLDVKNRRVGKIADGSKFVILSDRYLKPISERKPG